MGVLFAVAIKYYFQGPVSPPFLRCTFSLDNAEGLHRDSLESVSASWLMMSWNPFAHLLFYPRVFRIIREVMPFPLIFLVIIQLFRSVSIYDISVSVGSNAVILVTKSGYSRFIP